jgi:hypothetical protein
MVGAGKGEIMKVEDLHASIKTARRLQRKGVKESKAVEAAINLESSPDDRLEFREALVQLGILEIGRRFRFKKENLPV